MVLFITGNTYCKHFSEVAVLCNVFGVKVCTVNSVICNIFLSSGNDTFISQFFVFG